MSKLDYRNVNIRNTHFVRVFMALITSKILLEFLNAFINVYIQGINTSVISIIIYLILFLYFIYTYFKYNIRNDKRIYGILIIYLVYFLNYIFSDSKPEYISINMLILYFFYIPISILIFSNITDWSSLYKENKKLIYTGLILGLITSMISIINHEKISETNTNYMTFSYIILPIICIGLYCAKIYKNKLLFSLSLANIIIMLFYGARMCLIISVFYFFLLYFIKSNIMTKLLFILLILLVIINFNISMRFEILNKLSLLSKTFDSHIIKEYINGSIFQLGDRKMIYDVCINYINDMDLDIMGLFGDRKILLQSGISSYSHNIILEILISFGWIFGIIFIAVLTILIVLSFKKSIINNTSILYVAFFLSFFCKFFISSSFIIDSYFFIFVGIIFGYLKKDSYSRRGIYEYNVRTNY